MQLEFVYAPKNSLILQFMVQSLTETSRLSRTSLRVQSRSNSSQIIVSTELKPSFSKRAATDTILNIFKLKNCHVYSNVYAVTWRISPLADSRQAYTYPLTPDDFSKSSTYCFDYSKFQGTIILVPPVRLSGPDLFDCKPTESRAGVSIT